MIESYLRRQNDSYTFTTYKAHKGILPASEYECDAFILTGSHHSVFDPDVLWINSLQTFVIRLHKADIKTFGICFGHQLIAETMGGKVERADYGWQVGVHQAQVQQTASFMQPEKQVFNIAMMCEDQIQTLPESATVLASSPRCDYMMLQYGKHMLSIQGRPEFSQSFAKALINTRHHDFPQKRLEAGLTALDEKPLDNDLFFSWVNHFLRTD